MTVEAWRLVRTTSLGQNTLVNPPPGLRSRCTATIEQLDILDLVRSGALPAHPLTAPEGTVEIDLPISVGSTEEVEVLDREGVPVACLRVSPEAGRRRSHGPVVWLSRRTSRPFESLHLGPTEVPEPTGVVLLRSAVPSAKVRRALADAGRHPLLLALLQLDGAIDRAALATARQVHQLAAPGSSVMGAIAPIPPALGAAERATVVAAYARGRSVVEIGTVSGEPSGPGLVVFLTGLSGSGKSTLARGVRDKFLDEGIPVTLLDGDVVRQHLSGELGFSVEDREINVRRVGWVAAEIGFHGGVAICSMIAPFTQSRDAVRQMVQARGAQFILVHVSTPLSECERRDRKGLYAQARRGEIPDFTGISSPYETPQHPDVSLDTTDQDIETLVNTLFAHLPRRR